MPVLANTGGAVRARRSGITTVELWGPRAETNDVAVDSDTFSAVKRGATVCISLSPGAFGIPWVQCRGV